jgi:hypothetical protein
MLWIFNQFITHLQDLQIVCNVRTQEILPQGASEPNPMNPQAFPNTIRIDILEIRNHPNYVPLKQSSSGNSSSQDSGPINGYDISVYIVDDSGLADRMNTTTLWPACLPKAANTDYLPGNRGILAGWGDPLPTYLGKASTGDSYANDYLVTREGLFEEQPACADPAWMQSRTYYPPGTVCYTEAAWAGSVQFGLSGSSLVRPFRDRGSQETRYSFVGPLSVSKGSDRSLYTYEEGIIDYSSNPAVFTDARCYLGWIAEQYGLSLPAGTAPPPATCSQSTGEKRAVNNTECRSRLIDVPLFASLPDQGLSRCDFTNTTTTTQMGKCNLFSYDSSARPNYNLNFYFCLTKDRKRAICANDCPGVDPNAVVVGGEVAILSIAAATAAAAASGAAPNLLGPVLGAAVSLAGLGAGTAAMNRACAADECRARRSRRCCPLVSLNRQLLCPVDC